MGSASQQDNLPAASFDQVPGGVGVPLQAGPHMLSKPDQASSL